jgi:hypothetical protein
MYLIFFLAPFHNSEAYFKGRSRHFQWTVQGVFKERVRFDEMVTGQDFDRPFRNPPAMKLVDQALVLLKTKLPDTFEWYVNPQLLYVYGQSFLH